MNIHGGSQGGVDAPGDVTYTQISNSINNGVSIVLYNNHGGPQDWLMASDYYLNQDVDNLTNTDVLPYIWSVACETGQFHNTTCFAEAWLRATHNKKPS